MSIGLAALVVVSVGVTGLFLAHVPPTMPPTLDAAMETPFRVQTTGPERIEVRIDERASSLGVTIVPHEVFEDSRCPESVQCIGAGTVRVRATLESGLGSGAQVFVLGETITTEVEEVTLVEVAPTASSTAALEDGDYTFTFKIRKRDVGAF